MTSPSPQLCISAFQVSGPQQSQRPRLPSDQTGHSPADSHGLVPLGSILTRIGITKQTTKTLEAIQMVRERRENGKQELAYHARPFVLCGIPLRRPPTGELVHRRRNGKFFLEIVAHYSRGLPFGQDPLIPL